MANYAQQHLTLNKHASLRQLPDQDRAAGT